MGSWMDDPTGGLDETLMIPVGKSSFCCSREPESSQEGSE